MSRAASWRVDPASGRCSYTCWSCHALLAIADIITTPWRAHMHAGYVFNREKGIMELSHRTRTEWARAEQRNPGTSWATWAPTTRGPNRHNQPPGYAPNPHMPEVDVPLPLVAECLCRELNGIEQVPAEYRDVVLAVRPGAH